jgi:hypothetical protein
MTTISCDCPLNIKHCDHTSIEPNQFEQWPWSNFPNLPLLYLFLCKRTPLIPFLSKVKKMDKVDGPVADKTELIKLEIFMDPDNPSLRIQVLPSLCYLQVWMQCPRGVYQGLACWCPSVRDWSWYPWRNLLTRSGCFGICWKVKPCLTLSIFWGRFRRQKTQSSMIKTSQNMCLEKRT